MGTRLHNYREVREYLENEHLDWLGASTPRHIASRFLAPESLGRLAVSS
jgi:hypothetical protein